jgi:hypothetical protein
MQHDLMMLRGDSQQLPPQDYSSNRSFSEIKNVPQINPSCQGQSNIPEDTDNLDRGNDVVTEIITPDVVQFVRVQAGDEENHIANEALHFDSESIL